MSEKVLKAMEFLLYPLVRLALARNIGYSSLAGIIKFIMVKEAERQFGRSSGEPVSDSRLSIATGIHRKEIKRIRALSANDFSSFEPRVAAQVIARWLGDERLHDATGIKPLPRKKQAGDEIDFDDLVKSISTDIRPKVVLDELLDRGLVVPDADERLRLQPDALGLNQDQAETLQYLSLNIHDHLSTCVNNLMQPQQKMLDRCVHYQGLNAEAIAELGKLAEQQSMAALLAVNKAAQAMARDPARRGDRRMNFGAYFFQEQVQSSDSPP